MLQSDVTCGRYIGVSFLDHGATDRIMVGISTNIKGGKGYCENVSVTKAHIPNISQHTVLKKKYLFILNFIICVNKFTYILVFVPLYKHTHTTPTISTYSL